MVITSRREGNIDYRRMATDLYQKLDLGEEFDEMAERYRKTGFRYPDGKENKIMGNAALTELATAMGSTVTKDARNEHSRYDYASADAVYRHVRGVIFGAGLTVVQTEKELEFESRTNKAGKVSTWCRAVYDLGFAEVGQKPKVVEQVTVMVQITGSQSLGAARTYALKYWLRGKFLLATGDQAEDLDGQAAEWARQTPATRKPKPKPKPSKPKPKLTEQAQQAQDDWALLDADQLAVEYLRYGLEKGRTEQDLEAHLKRVFGTAEPSRWTSAQIDQLRSWISR